MTMHVHSPRPIHPFEGRLFFGRNLVLPCFYGPALTCLLLMCFAGASVAQTFPSIPDSSDRNYYFPLPKFLSDSYFYIQAGTAIPIGQFGKQPDPKSTVVDPFQGKTGTGAAIGFAGELGVRRAFVVMPKEASRNYPFWGASVGGAYNALNWKRLDGNWANQKPAAFIQGAGLLQLGLAHKHNSRWVVEGYTALVLPFVTRYPDNSIKGSTSRPTDFSLVVQDGSAKWAPGVAAGITFRTRHFRIGAEWFRHRSTVSYTYTDTYQSSVETPTAFFDQQTVRFYLGVQF